ncbi:pilus assembly protein PilC [Neisseria meningitidis]|nr:hypothetical protein [Neisseria meningitidis]CWO23876.1 pilus assembly protein PilC [Neisseria meningitidis]CWS99743.1 pilus assembly protein PilC [Neisseria meningitidis]
MNKTWKRQVFRHTALYTAILMFSHTGGGGGRRKRKRKRKRKRINTLL